MTDLETQVVKIQLGDNKQSSSFVYTLAETIDSAGTEVYVICELPMFNPAAADECQRISQAITASLKRSYRTQANSTTFENALTIINEELSKLVTIGKTHWLGKLNAVIAVKRNNVLSVSSVGKISALLYRGGKFVSITEPGNSNQPLKTFEHFSEGRLRLGDMFILSTSQLFNHLSIDRIQKIIDKNELPAAAQEIIEILQDDMGPEVACGTIFALQVEPGIVEDEEEVDLGNYLASPTDTLKPKVSSQVKTSGMVPEKMKSYASTSATIAKNFAKDLKEKYIKRSYWQGIVDKSGQSIGVVQGRLKKTADKISPQKLNGYSRQKKFFLVAAGILLVVLVANIVIARWGDETGQQQTVSVEQLTTIEKLLNDANASLIFGDEARARQFFEDAINQLNQLPQSVEGENSAKLAELRNQARELDQKLNKVEQAEVRNLGTLANSSSLIGLPDYVAAENNRTIVSYDRATGSISDNKLSTSESIVSSVALTTANRAVIYNGSELFIWNTQTGVLLGAYDTNIPGQDDFGGMETYSVNNKVYLIDQDNSVIRSLSTTNSGFTNPQISVEDSSLATATDLAIDGDIYVLSGGMIIKFNSGKRQEFNSAISNLAENSKIYTELDYTYLYVLDTTNNKISILNKDGSLYKNLNSSQFTNLKDFVVDEENNIIYVLNGSELLEVKF